MTSPRDSTALTAGEPEQSRRPSFSKFWKKTKQVLHGNRGDNRVENRIEFVQPEKQSRDVVQQCSESPEAGSESSPAKPLTASEKAKLRRAQVRRAQVQHRQRKAEYVKKLELDITHFRELIALAQADVGDLEKENEAMKAQAQLFGIAISMAALEKRPLSAPMEGVEQQIDRFLSQNQDVAVLGNPQASSQSQVEGSVQQSSEPTDMFGDIDIDDIIISLKNDNQLATPVFSIRSNVSNSSFSNQASSIATSPPMSEGGYILSLAQEQLAVNFILSLEHSCWDHFWLGDFPGHQHQSERSMGHSLMASTICMANAPESVFRGRKLIGNPPDCEESRARFAELSMNQVAPTISYEWSSPRISLASLHDLASSLNPGDKELTPIQAWFELADRYPLDVLLDAQLLQALSHELNGVVKCLFFGAVMEREAFESVVCRLLGPSLDQMMADTIIEQLEE
ncbi:hypothetical protein B0J13DRAFT_21161 [Dactylonectria estremocensis]|uniref:BZIP domain-containing protein n=1 Tax=Dactylonectria estremocensis TaxID=1079267 RepID=A0A9P9JDU3_9HYPO|nr:hypothetical protein B0J13DRAFT_21161 [Dactylonectria estremocensis]